MIVSRATWQLIRVDDGHVVHDGGHVHRYVRGPWGLEVATDYVAC